MTKQEINEIEVLHDIITWKMQCDDPEVGEDEEEIDEGDDLVGTRPDDR